MLGKQKVLEKECFIICKSMNDCKIMKTSRKKTTFAFVQAMCQTFAVVTDPSGSEIVGYYMCNWFETRKL